MLFLHQWLSLSIISIISGFIGAFLGTVPLMWLVALIHEHVFAGVAPAGYWDLFLIDWILGYWTCALGLGIKTLLEDS